MKSKKSLRRRLPMLLGGAFMLIVIVGVVFLIRNFLDNPDKPNTRRVQQISIIKPPEPPPPPPPEVKPPEVKEEVKLDEPPPPQPDAPRPVQIWDWMRMEKARVIRLVWWAIKVGANSPSAGMAVVLVITWADCRRISAMN